MDDGDDSDWVHVSSAAFRRARKTAERERAVFRRTIQAHRHDDSADDDTCLNDTTRGRDLGPEAPLLRKPPRVITDMRSLVDLVDDGRANEELFELVVFRLDRFVRRATWHEDTEQHIDGFWRRTRRLRDPAAPSCVRSYDVKAQKRLVRESARLLDAFVYVEFEAVGGRPGWLLGHADDIVFRMDRETFWAVARDDLCRLFPDVRLVVTTADGADGTESADGADGAESAVVCWDRATRPAVARAEDLEGRPRSVFTRRERDGSHRGTVTLLARADLARLPHEVLWIDG